MKQMVVVACVLIVGAIAHADDSKQQIEHGAVLGKSLAVFKNRCRAVGGDVQQAASDDWVCNLRRMETIACVTAGSSVCRKTNYRWPYPNTDVAKNATRKHGEPNKVIDDDGKGCMWAMWPKAAVKICPDSTHYMQESSPTTKPASPRTYLGQTIQKFALDCRTRDATYTRRSEANASCEQGNLYSAVQAFRYKGRWIIAKEMGFFMKVTPDEAERILTLEKKEYGDNYSTVSAPKDDGEPCTVYQWQFDSWYHNATVCRADLLTVSSLNPER